LQFGNLTSARIDGLKAKLDWGKIDANGAPENDKAKTREVTFSTALPPGAWTVTQVVLEGVPPTELGFVRLKEVGHRGIDPATTRRNFDTISRAAAKMKQMGYDVRFVPHDNDPVGTVVGWLLDAEKEGSVALSCLGFWFSIPRAKAFAECLCSVAERTSAASVLASPRVQLSWQ
jgi:hypothetical protein